ncbi:phosphonate metabolism protein/1,5-bisphosphokinase (PRPP-forming) PhnN [Variovorax sp. PAMC 28711]|uniref:phosphonate metabolism protein/1,5-bisphosphokinase (PRPP-forming) PhnN n=1 Tax=Variovorax sp. PAMC 28711 TaxID=1795631 RepID=UPI00078B75B5|nr:phosphonate metabolism protein/1,5-bisphosphokinase (PRPP-forming) PhnN [Variovorax sp. PAMC 28711]AMM23985.1 hypothetical protein AX767_06185 [Variovorax sp. PAMC 28711]
MTTTLIYVMGPSGAGKDSLLAWVKSRTPLAARIAFARRTITRAARPGDEDHESVDEAAFERLRDGGAFALDWQANGLRYGIRETELVACGANGVVVVNGSRAYLDVAAARHPGLTVVHITAGLDTLKQRLAQRGRETAAEVEQRVLRSLSFRPPSGISVFDIANDGALEDAGASLQKLILDAANAVSGE